MALKWRGNEMKTVTHVYAHFVTHVFAPCREGISKERDNSMEGAPLPSPLPARASQGEGERDFNDGGCIKMRPA